MTRPLNFLHLTTFYPPYSFGGDAMYIYRLCHKLGDAGHHVDVVHCVDSYHLQHPGEPEIPFAEHLRVHRHELRSRFGWLSPLLTQQTGRPCLKMKTIHRLLEFDAGKTDDLRTALDVPREDEEIKTIADRWLSTLLELEQRAQAIIRQIGHMIELAHAR